MSLILTYANKKTVPKNEALSIIGIVDNYPLNSQY